MIRKRRVNAPIVVIRFVVTVYVGIVAVTGVVFALYMHYHLTRYRGFDFVNP